MNDARPNGGTYVREALAIDDGRSRATGASGAAGPFDDPEGAGFVAGAHASNNTRSQVRRIKGPSSAQRPRLKERCESYGARSTAPSSMTLLLRVG